ncbi:MAG TPA: rhombotarget lipoprotein [Steroidobacteraceae bacterium]|jgi:rhombotail lipoprotein
MKAPRLFLLPLVLLATACAGTHGGSRREGVSSSLVEYLYPAGEKPPSQSGRFPNMQLPLNVGLAFVPAGSGQSQALSEVERMMLLNEVKGSFTGRDFIAEIAVIPETFMRGGRGFTALDQTAQLYGLDVMALVSFDEVTHATETTSSLRYWTIVGDTVIEGNKNDVRTFVETAVFDVPTHKLLFRAPGSSATMSNATLVDREKGMRVTQRQGFQRAMADMMTQLDKALDAFKERIRADGSKRD